MPLFNAAATLKASVGSVLAQSCPDWELLLIDDGCTDGSAALAQALVAQDARITLLTLPANRGAAAARNAGLHVARGRFIAFLDADDLWRPEKLARQLAFHARTGATLTHTGYSRMSDPEEKLINVERVAAVTPYSQMLRRNHIGCLTAMYDTQHCGKVFMPELRRQHDFALWLRLVREHGPALGLDEDLAIYRVRSGSLSADKGAGAADVWRILRDQERLPWAKAAWCFCHYAAHGLRHRLVQRPRSDAPIVTATDRIV